MKFKAQKSKQKTGNSFKKRTPKSNTPSTSSPQTMSVENLPAESANSQLREQSVLQMQHFQGNRFVQNQLAPPKKSNSDQIQRFDLPGWQDISNWFSGGQQTNSSQSGAQSSQTELNNFMGKEYEEKNYHTSSGIGLFDAHYTPTSGDLTVTVKVCFNFENGDPTDPQWVAAVGGPVEAAKYTADQFQWSEDEKTEWRTTAVTEVQDFWSERYTFHSTRANFANLPTVNVRVRVLETPATGDNPAHFVATVKQWPTDGGSLPEFINPPDNDHDDQSTALFQETAGGLDVRHFTRTTNTRNAYSIAATKNPQMIYFGQGGSTVSATDKTRLKEFGEALGRPEIPPFPVTMTGHASPEGSNERNMALSEDRARNVSNEVVTAGAKKQPTIVARGEEGMIDDPAVYALERRVDIEVGDFESDQRTVLHEFGHMFGLDDEYPTADGPGSERPVGTEVKHSKTTTIPGGETVVAHHNESIMSNGEVVRPHHYVTFLEVLGKMTGTNGEWDVGPAIPRGPGDFPLPTGDTVYA